MRALLHPVSFVLVSQLYPISAGRDKLKRCGEGSWICYNGVHSKQ